MLKYDIKYDNIQKFFLRELVSYIQNSTPNVSLKKLIEYNIPCICISPFVIVDKQDKSFLGDDNCIIYGYDFISRIKDAISLFLTRNENKCTIFSLRKYNNNIVLIVLHIKKDSRSANIAIYDFLEPTRLATDDEIKIIERSLQNYDITRRSGYNSKITSSHNIDMNFANIMQKAKDILSGKDVDALYNLESCIVSGNYKLIKHIFILKGYEPFLKLTDKNRTMLHLLVMRDDIDNYLDFLKDLLLSAPFSLRNAVDDLKKTAYNYVLEADKKAQFVFEETNENALIGYYKTEHQEPEKEKEIYMDIFFSYYKALIEEGIDSVNKANYELHDMLNICKKYLKGFVKNNLLDIIREVDEDGKTVLHHLAGSTERLNDISFNFLSELLNILPLHLINIKDKSGKLPYEYITPENVRVLCLFRKHSRLFIDSKKPKPGFYMTTVSNEERELTTSTTR